VIPSSSITDIQTIPIAHIAQVRPGKQIPAIFRDQEALKEDGRAVPQRGQLHAAGLCRNARSQISKRSNVRRRAAFRFYSQLDKRSTRRRQRLVQIDVRFAVSCRTLRTNPLGGLIVKSVNCDFGCIRNCISLRCFFQLIFQHYSLKN
jgi:hypothetical protein